MRKLAQERRICFNLTRSRFSCAGSVDDDAIPISAIWHAVYCLRQSALIHIERLREENRFTAEGRVLHAATQELAGGNCAAFGASQQCRSPPVRLGLAGVADVVELHRAGQGEKMPYPVEYKRGKPKAHRADEA